MTRGEANSDLINRQAVLDAFWKLDVELRPSAIDAFLNMVNNIPSVKQEPEADVLDKIRDEISDNAFSVLNPHNTYEDINVIDLDSAVKIIDKYISGKADMKTSKDPYDGAWIPDYME